MPTSEQKEARHAQQLRDLGFTTIDKELSLVVRGNLPRRLSRNERRQLKKQGYRPWFTMTETLTFATDETGQTWKGPGNTDLTAFGYEDKSESAQTTLRSMRNTDPRYH